MLPADEGYYHSKEGNDPSRVLLVSLQRNLSPYVRKLSSHIFSFITGNSVKADESKSTR